MWSVAEQNLLNGNSVLIDAPLVKEMQDATECERLRNFVESTQARLCVIRLVCSETQLRRRLESRGLARDLEKLKEWDTWKSEEPIWFAVPFDHHDMSTEDHHTENIEAAIRYIGQGVSTDEWERLRVLWQGAIDSFNQRRHYEWQMCLAAWGALVGAIIVASEKVQVQLTDPRRVCLSILGFFIFFVQAYWILKLQKRNNLDRDIAKPYWDGLRQLVSVKLDDQTEREINKAKNERSSFWPDWNHRSQVAVTWSLFVTLVMILDGPGPAVGVVSVTSLFLLALVLATRTKTKGNHQGGSNSDAAPAPAAKTTDGEGLP